MVTSSAEPSSRFRGPRRRMTLVVWHKHLVSAAEAIFKNFRLRFSHLNAKGITCGGFSTILRGVAIALNILGRWFIDNLMSLFFSPLANMSLLLVIVSLVLGLEHH
jgi:hypothetical protein